MVTVSVTKRIPAPPEEVWPELADLSSHAEWMSDAESIVFTSEQTRGVGTTMEVKTRVGPLRTRDVLEVTGWEEGEAVEIAHRGLVNGKGRLEVQPDSNHSVVTWIEQLAFPWWLGGGITAVLARPILGRIWERNLARLAARVSAP